ncbi:conserved hypothetical protein [Pseudarthrobacter chlorophenolicus A6]|uniref:Small multidrug efflux protein n=1 Tax=Pseudarthrobacter chlorophenolicus (strain ATCC 700700 / DSM 12829 / CIP 107037 / JCM 12360 / KCTC 9906 / NCIMB 13794 / A6) TaxID=452863 RepID=B8H7Q9_PSECP|nr:hypothetical protein [Pseudarthrobacter chlorophenolicus]ACL39839.1 conserved hypothetical protein [Pseudarthrobacter chlorophenolicus A6]SDQ92826.1 hypothetical protein SAMN04489738_3642 [Pseudarthrobacter chlorophenolicus]
MNNPYEGLQGFIDQVPDILQPLLIAVAGTIPYIEGEGAAAFGILVGINPIIAAIAAATGNVLCVLGVVLLGSRARERVLTRRASQTGPMPVGNPKAATRVGALNERAASAALPDPATAVALTQPADNAVAKPTRRAKGRERLRRWVVRFGVPGASLLAPLALPTMLTAAFFVTSGVPKQWVIIWQIIAIVLWTAAVALASTGALAVLGW